MWWAACDTREHVLEDALLLNAAGAAFAERGIKLCYHNHGHEFTNSFNGVCAFDMLAERTDPAAVYFEVDIAWATYGGADPVAVLRRMKDRVPAIHVKDFSRTDIPDQFTAVGTGIVPVEESVKTAIEVGIPWIVVEQDKLRNLSPIETITVSALNLKEWGLI